MYSFLTFFIARGGGGGSSSGGGGGGGFSGGGSSGGSGGGDIGFLWFLLGYLPASYAIPIVRRKFTNHPLAASLGFGLVYWIILSLILINFTVGGIFGALFGIGFAYFNTAFGTAIGAAWRQNAKTKATLKAAAAADPNWAEDALRARVADVFVKFQNAWSTFDVEAMKSLMTEDYRKQMILELGAMKAMGRQNVVENPEIINVMVTHADDQEGHEADSFVAGVYAKANDRLLDTKNDKQLYADSSPFTEYWRFVRSSKKDWLLAGITQQTADDMMMVSAISKFAASKGFYYDGDFGWLLMPNRGVLFGKSNFKTSDINNHVIGTHKNKIVELYTFVPNAVANTDHSQYLVAQTTLPREYNNILVRRKKGMELFGPRGLVKHQMESVDFNKEFVVYSAREDDVSTFELLNPQFMERIRGLDFEVNIEAVGQYLYMYTKENEISYEQMWEVLSWAFDELKQ